MAWSGSSMSVRVKNVSVAEFPRVSKRSESL